MVDPPIASLGHAGSPSAGQRNAPGARIRGRWEDASGTAYRIRTGDLRLERAVSWASRRMRQERDVAVRSVAEDTRGPPDPAIVRGAGSGLEAVRLEERPERLRDLEIALLAQHQAVVGVGAEWLERGVKPV